MRFLDELAARRRFGMKPGLETISVLCRALGEPQAGLRCIHVAGTNGKGAVCALLDSCLRAAGHSTGRYTSPHLVRLNERFSFNGEPLGDAALEDSAARVEAALRGAFPTLDDVTFFEALTAVAFDAFARLKPDFAILECGLGGRLDATNICRPVLSVITRIGLDHCDWLGDTCAKIAVEKAGIVKPGVPVVLGANAPEVRAVVSARAREVDAPFVYAPDRVRLTDVPAGLSLPGLFNRENAQTAMAALQTLGVTGFAHGFARAVWPGRFQRVRNFIVDGAHNPPAAAALVEALKAAQVAPRELDLIVGFCGDKDVSAVLRLLAPFVRRAYAVRTCNPRSLDARETARHLRGAGIDGRDVASLAEAVEAVGSHPALICGSLFLAGEALVALGAYPWAKGPNVRFDPAERLTPSII